MPRGARRFKWGLAIIDAGLTRTYPAAAPRLATGTKAVVTGGRWPRRCNGWPAYVLWI